MDRIEFDTDELQAASDWHGGLSSMLYAIASTGSLSRGSIRPTNDDGAPMSDTEWLVCLASRLEGEAMVSAAHATDGDDVIALESIAAKCRAAVTELTGVFSDWADVLNAARSGRPLWYHAPLDLAPRRIRVDRVYKNGKLRIDPMSNLADKFTADEGHLDRFRSRAA